MTWNPCTKTHSSSKLPCPSLLHRYQYHSKLASPSDHEAAEFPPSTKPCSSRSDLHFRDVTYSRIIVDSHSCNCVKQSDELILDEWRYATSDLG